jgi:hypothetical protein
MGMGMGMGMAMDHSIEYWNPGQVQVKHACNIQMKNNPINDFDLF